jgi:hypothetical protein
VVAELAIIGSHNIHHYTDESYHLPLPSRFSLSSP